ncbi:urea ABC transporter ATP-binding protein UrtD [Aneurinibacillus danicus]|uniref:ABC transporter ATP-binding protein n=1 Tax=Aneurinibacillus danicus TaxID=267746 RepID=A0A511V3R4_9BACL|nr:urea ABC transporter ATP-binding protein UrtD [Aneurinibacillus danicus]GEN33560.1 ABC transporter ATP-binding protein [Aneurinibacillus danicus]
MSRQPILSCRNIVVDFDGFKAIQGVDLTIEEGEIRFLIGPNGAGKTTMLDVICGKTRALSGQIWFHNRIDIVKKQEHEIVNLGIARKFQAPSIFLNLTVFENLELAMKQNRHLWAVLRARIDSGQRKRMMEVLAQIGLADQAERKAGLLSHGQKQWLEIGMQLMQEPKLLLLDEPIAGMTGTERERTGELIREIAQTCSVIVVEHDMDFVRTFSKQVTVMHEGKILCEGTMEQVQRDPRVAEVYLGKGKAEHAESVAT